MVWETGATLISCGLTPENCALFVQSHVREHAELCWLFNTLTPLGMLERMTQFKDKSKQHKENINAGLLNYPILQAADIALYKADLVPVGEDQSQHLELTRELVRKFNNKFGKVFPLPETRIGRAPKILGLDGLPLPSHCRIPMSPPPAPLHQLPPARAHRSLWKRLVPPLGFRTELPPLVCP